MRGRPRGFEAGVAVGAMVLVLMCWGIVYKIIKADCEERGGHIEAVWGGRVGYTCDGAQR